MIRTVTIKPGFDCLNAPCQHEKQGQHGINGGEAYYAVTQEDRRGRKWALVLTVGLARYPETVGRNGDWMNEIRGWDISMHAQVPREGYGTQCEYVGKCDVLTTSASNARQFAQGLTDDQVEVPPEAFWVALEAEFVRQATELREPSAVRQRLLEAFVSSHNVELTEWVLATRSTDAELLGKLCGGVERAKALLAALDEEMRP